LRRLLSGIDAGSDSVVHRRSLMTAPATAAALRKGLRDNWTTADLLRLVREMRSNAVLQRNIQIARLSTPSQLSLGQLST